MELRGCRGENVHQVEDEGEYCFYCEHDELQTKPSSSLPFLNLYPVLINSYPSNLSRPTVAQVVLSINNFFSECITSNF